MKHKRIYYFVTILFVKSCCFRFDVGGGGGSPAGAIVTVVLLSLLLAFSSFFTLLTVCMELKRAKFGWEL